MNKGRSDGAVSASLSRILVSVAAMDSGVPLRERLAVWHTKLPHPFFPRSAGACVRDGPLVGYENSGRPLRPEVHSGYQRNFGSWISIRWDSLVRDCGFGNCTLTGCREREVVFRRQYIRGLDMHSNNHYYTCPAADQESTRSELCSNQIPRYQIGLEPSRFIVITNER